MRTAAEIREAIRKKHRAGTRQRTAEKQLGAASNHVEHVSNRDFDLAAGKGKKRGSR
jgi:hypothetical protein